MAAKPELISRWHACALARDVDAIDDLLADDVVFQSPAVHTPQRGRAISAKYLRAAMTLLNNEAFRYTGEWYGERSAVLEFESEVDGLFVNGVDIIHWNDDDKITLFKVMVRPLKGLNALVAAMGKALQKA